MRTTAPYWGTFLLSLAWDWLATVSVRQMAAQSQWAVPLAVLLAAFLWFAARLAVNHPRLLVPYLMGAAVGTELGILWP